MRSTNPQAFSGVRVFVRDLHPKTGSRDALRACSSLRGCRVRGGLAARRCFHCTCRATSEAGLPQLWHGCPVPREFPLRRDPNRAAPPSLLRCAWTAKRCPSARSAKPQSVDGGRRSQYAQPNHSQPACKLQVRADGRDCPYRQAWLSACPHWQAQQARRPSTQSPKHLAAQPSSASERQDKEAACGPHSGMDSIAHRWYRSGEGPVFARPVLHRKSVCGTI